MLAATKVALNAINLSNLVRNQLIHIPRERVTKRSKQEERTKRMEVENQNSLVTASSARSQDTELPIVERRKMTFEPM